MIYLAWAIIAVAYLAGVPLGLVALFSSPNDGPIPWWQPIVGWTSLNACIAALFGVVWSLWWAIDYVAGVAP